MVKIKTNDNTKLIPRKSKSNNYIKLEFPGIRVSQCEYREGPVGLTYIHFNNKARVYMEVRGGQPTYINCLSTINKQFIDGINNSGGSKLGLESTTGLTAESLKNNKYKNFNKINGSIIWSQNLKINKIYPDIHLGRFAYNQKDKKLYNGQVGAGLSANHGQGWAFKKINKIKILALCVNNAIGVIFKDNEPVHTPGGKKNYYFKLDRINLNDTKKINDNKIKQNTTNIVLITNLKLDIDDLKQLNQQINASIGESIRPYNTLADGDTLYTCSTDKIDNNFNQLQSIKFFDECSKVLKEAILNSIK
jgi:L-aminopeptidase/D-esterase-like protein